MTNGALADKLAEFARRRRFTGKGPLCVALVVTDHARELGLPLDAESLITEGRGQVLGLGKAKVQSILARHGVTRVLAEEGGRTSRGSIGKMQEYAAFLNALHKDGEVDLDAIEDFWIGEARKFFTGRPFRLKLDSARGLRAVVGELLGQARKRQKTAGGMQYAGAMLQHLVGAKLDCAMGEGLVEHHSFSTADAPSGRAGDFLAGSSAIHVTTTPSEAVFRRCRENLDAGLKPLLVTLSEKVQLAEGLADNAGLAGRVDIFDAEQFIALNLHELGRFDSAKSADAVKELIERYNAIVEKTETDPSLRIEMGR